MTIRSFARATLLSATAVMLGCNHAASPGPGGPLEFTATVSPSTIRVGQTATFTLTLTNTGSETITLHFPSGCQIVPYVERADNGAVVYPRGGGWMCTQALTQLRLEGGGAVTRSIDVHGGEVQPTIHTGAQLAPGSYRLYGELGVPPRPQGRSGSASLTVVE